MKNTNQKLGFLKKPQWIASLGLVIGAFTLSAYAFTSPPEGCTPGSCSSPLEVDFAAQTVTVNSVPTENGHVANKAYVDSAVVASGGGYSGVSMMSARSPSTQNHANAAKYCWNLNASAAASMNGDTSTVYSDWRLPTVEEAAIFEGTVSDSNYTWTATVRDASSNTWIFLRLSDGYWNANNYHGNYYARCVR